MLLGFTLGPAEIAVIVLVVVLVFGPSKLPQLGSSVGKMLRGFKKEMKSMNEDDAADTAGTAGTDDAALPRPQPGELDVTPSKEKKSAT